MANATKKDYISFKGRKPQNRGGMGGTQRKRIPPSNSKRQYIFRKRGKIPHRKGGGAIQGIGGILPCKQSSQAQGGEGEKGRKRSTAPVSRKKLARSIPGKRAWDLDTLRRKKRGKQNKEKEGERKKGERKMGILSGPSR